MAAGKPKTPAQPEHIVPIPGDSDIKPPVNLPYKTPESLHCAMKRYFTACEKANDGAGVFPDEAGMRIFLKLGHDSYRAYREDHDFDKVFDWAQDMRESWAARRLAAEPRNAQAYLNILKQTANGGWVDRKQDKGDKTLVIKTSGVGGDEAGL